MLIREVIQRVQSAYSKGVQSRSSRLSSRHIYNKMVSVRSTLISQEAKKNQKVNQWNYQPLPCVKMIPALPYECPDIPDVGIKWLKSEQQLPKPLTDLNSHLIQSVTTLDGKIQYDEVLFHKVKYVKGNKYTGQKARRLIKNNYLFITSVDTSPEAVTVIGLWEDPIAAYEFPSFCGEASSDCISYLDLEFPMDADMVDTLVTLAASEFIEQWKTKEDKLNNDEDDSRQ